MHPYGERREQVPARRAAIPIPVPEVMEGPFCGEFTTIPCRPCAHALQGSRVSKSVKIPVKQGGIGFMVEYLML